jgi:hypothetical protein
MRVASTPPGPRRPSCRWHTVGPWRSSRRRESRSELERSLIQCRLTEPRQPECQTATGWDSEAAASVINSNMQPGLGLQAGSAAPGPTVTKTRNASKMRPSAPPSRVPDTRAVRHGVTGSRPGPNSALRVGTTPTRRRYALPRSVHCPGCGQGIPTGRTKSGYLVHTCMNMYRYVPSTYWYVM